MPRNYLEYIKTLQIYFRNTKKHFIMLGGNVKKLKYLDSITYWDIDNFEINIPLKPELLR